jgi:hypothetical protein
MKILAAALAVGVLTIPVGGAQQRLPDVVRDGLRGPVHGVTVEVAPLISRHGRSVEGPRVPVSTAVYDANGDQIGETRYVDGRLVERTAYRYTPDGTQIAESSVRSSDAVMGLVSLSSDATGRDAGGQWRMDRQVLRSGYDVRGLRLETSTYEKLGGEEVGISRELYRYDADGRLVEARSGSIDGVVREITRYTYGAAGDLVQCDILRGDGSLERKVTYGSYRRDARGNWVRRTEVETFAGGRVADERVRYRTIIYNDDLRRVQLAAKDPREATGVARSRGGRCPYGSDARGLTAKLEGSETASMGTDGLFLSVALSTHFNPKKVNDPSTLADTVERPMRPRRAGKSRRTSSVDPAPDDDSTRVDDGTPTDEPALVPAR